MNALGPICAFLSSCTWAIGVSTYARLARTPDAAAINTTRAVVSGPLFLLLVLVGAGGAGEAAATAAAIPAEQLFFLGLSIAASYAFGDVLFLFATRHLGVPAALSIASCYPLWAALGGVAFRGETLGARRLVGVLTVVAGTIVVIAASAREAPASAPAGALRSPAGPARARAVLVGTLLALATSAMWALNSVALNVGSEGLPVALASLLRAAFALALCPLVGLVTRRLARRDGAARAGLVVPWSALRAALPVFLVEGFGGTLFFTYGLSHSPVAVGAALSSLAPVVAVPVALLTRAERFSTGKTAGIALVVAGIFLLVGAPGA